MMSTEPVAAASGVTLVRLLAARLSLYFLFLLRLSKIKYHIYHFPRTACRTGGGIPRRKYHRSLTIVRFGNRFRQIRARAV